MGGPASDETALTGDTLAKVQAAALAAAGSGSTLIRAETDADGNAKYEAHVRKADGTCVTVYLDESFKVVKTETAPQAGERGEGGSGRGRARRRCPWRLGRGEGGCIGGTNGTDSTTGTITNSRRPGPCPCLAPLVLPGADLLPGGPTGLLGPASAPSPGAARR